MFILHALSEFLDGKEVSEDSPPTYWYEGRCPQSGAILRLPRTRLAEAIACGLMQQFASDERDAGEGKMYGILLVQTPTGEQGVLKAFSGLLNGQSVVEGWVPPSGGRDRLAVEEARTLASLEQIKQELIALQTLQERQPWAALEQEWATRLQTLALEQQQRKQERQQQRQRLSEVLSGAALDLALEELNQASRWERRERRQLKRQRDEALQPLQEMIERADARMAHLKQQRKILSRQLQAQMDAAYYLTNFSGQSLSLQQLMAGGSLPTGTGDCCAPKLLHYAATHRLTPLAMAEFWWGSCHQDRVPGDFYGACAGRCQPLMGFLLSGLSGKTSAVESRSLEVEILYKDRGLLVINKPAGLLSVPGRDCAGRTAGGNRADSAVSRLRHGLSAEITVRAVHRLDRETSGILLLARDEFTYRQLSQQFQQRRVHKVYEAILVGRVTQESGVIELPLWGDPRERPCQKVDWQFGKPSITHFQVMGREGHYTRVELMPVTGRTHQIRVHAADARGLGAVILGDRLYRCVAAASRLHLHARELSFEHPHSGQTIHIKTDTPF
jgi:tRNA pseudouridine32 synthase/23S rRNA pseudouridine746 synthase